MNYVNNRKNHLKWIKDHTTLKPEAHYATNLNSNFVTLSDAVKIYTMDTITDMAKDVFGPYGGLYGELEYSSIVGAAPNIENANYLKSKDGANFFKKIAFRSHYSIVILKAIQQLTKYIAGYDAETSRDGTTSLAMLSSIMAKNLIIEGNHKFNYRKIPSQILKEMEEVIKYVGTKLVDDYKIPIYDGSKYLQVGSVNGKDLLINTLKTTTENHPCVNEFIKVMDLAIENNYDITSIHKAAPEKKYGIPGIKLNVISGCKLPVRHLTSDLSGAFNNLTTGLFVLDGYIRPEHRDIYVHYFKLWIQQLCNTRMHDGSLLFDGGEYGLHDPIILVTRTPDYLINVYKDIHLKGIDINIQHNGKLLTRTVRPKIMLALNTEDREVYYNDVMSVFNNKIDITKIDRAIGVLRKSEAGYTANGGMKSVGINEINLMSFFPKIEAIKYDEEETFVSMWKEPVFNEELDKEHVDKYARDKESFTGEYQTKECFIKDFKVITGFDGKSFYITPTHQDLTNRIKAYREVLLTNQKEYSSLAATDDNIEKRLAMFSGVSLEAEISVRADDEWYELYGIYEDALGVFESGHAFGVMPGANTFFLKKSTEFIHNIIEQARRQFVGCNQVKKDEYSTILTYIAKCIITSYLECYSYIVRDGELVKLHRTEYIDRMFNDVYDVNIADFDQTIFEAARTTRDVFHGAVTVAFDMLRLKRIKVNSIAEWEEVNNLNKTLPYNGINEREEY